jgi:hypothetical protein
VNQPFDIFKKEPGGRFVWCGTAITLSQANLTVKKLNDHVSEFLIIDEVTGEQTIITPGEQTPGRSVAGK